VGFVGLAPGVTIVPVRVLATGGFGPPPVDPAALARGINWAADHNVDVIDVSLVTYSDDQAVGAAVANALAKGTIVVAAVGDLGDTNGGNQTPYPAAYDGVIGVGAIDQAGNRWPGSQHGPYVDLVAPGAAVPTAQRGGGMTEASGTGVASGFVAAAAALTRAKRGGLTVSQVRRLLTATATPAPLGADSPEYGHGVVNPYGAVNDQTTNGSPAPLPALVRPASEQASAWARSRDLALAGAAGAVLVVLAVLGVAVALPRGRRRFWRPALAALPKAPAEPEEPGPPAPLFGER
jgi:hypothetical protein